MHPEALRLAEGFIKDFWSANHEIRWLGIEQERLLWLSPNTALVGKRDALGLTGDGKPFFADWKTASIGKKRFIKDEKRRWRLNPQALTYGVLNENDNAHHFTVRWVFKTEPVTTDFEWYEYEQSELKWWRGELLSIADQIRHWRSSSRTNWPVGLEHCTKYGENYRCPFRDEGCWIQNFSFRPSQMTPRTESHLDIENDLRQAKTGEEELVVLDATRVGDWIGCHEYYRRIWEEGLHEESEALTIGHDFHEIIGAHLNKIKSEQEKVK
jgi:hypothetical protein